MGHRHLSDTSRFFDRDPGWNRGQITAEHANIKMGRASGPGNGSLHHPLDNTPTSGINYHSAGNFNGRSIEHSSRNFWLEGPQIHVSFAGPSHDRFPHFSAGESFCMAPHGNSAHPHPSHHSRFSIHGVECGLPDHTTVTGRGPSKRKSPGISMSSERGSTSRSHAVGSSSSSGLQVEKPTSDNRNYSSGYGLPPNRGQGLLIGEDSSRNVRSRPRLDLEPNRGRNYLSNYSSLAYHPTCLPHNNPGQVNVANLNADATTYEHNRMNVSSTTHGRFSTPASSFLSHEMNQRYTGQSATDISGYHHEPILSRHLVSPPRYSHHVYVPSAWEGYHHYSQRAVPSLITDIGSSRVEQAAGSGYGQWPRTEAYTFRQPRPLSVGGWHNNDHREGRPRLAAERFQPFTNAVGAHDRVGSETFMMLDPSYIYGSRYFVDQYGDMRLDVDNMTYEELLALGESIGNVSTGLSEDVISRCLIQTNYRYSNRKQEEASCAICLEEYKKMDKVGELKKCGHDYHFDCIKKWLFMKNSCPICKGPALADNSKGK